MLLELLDGAGDWLVLEMADEIDVKHVFPVFFLGRTRFDFREIDAELIEGLDGFDEGARLIADGEKERSFVVSGWFTGFFSDDKKAGGIGGAILDVGLEHGEVVELGGECASHGGGALCGVVARELGGFGGRGDLDEIGVREVAENPLAALPEDLGVGVERFDLFARNGGHEAVLDAEEDLGADVEGGIDEEIEGVGDGAFGGVFDGDDAVVGFAAADLLENVSEIWLREIFDRVTEFGDCGLVRPGAFGAEVGDFEIVFEGEGGGHDLAINRANRGFCEAALIEFDEALQQGIFALGRVNLESVSFFDNAYVVNEFSAFREKIEKLSVERVNLGADVVKIHVRKR